MEELQKEIETTQKLKVREQFNNSILKEESDRIYEKNQAWLNKNEKLIKQNTQLEDRHQKLFHATAFYKEFYQKYFDCLKNKSQKE